MRTYHLIFIFSLLHILPAHSQSFKTLKNVSEKALSAFKEGKTESDKGQFAIAQGYYEKAIKIDSTFIDAYMYLADVCFEQANYTGAEKSFEKALRLDTVYAPLAFYRLAKIEWLLDKYAEAVPHLESYLRSNPQNGKTRGEAQRLLESARFAAYAVLHPVPFNPVSLGDGVNTDADEYFPTLTADGETLVFTRNEKVFMGDENFYRSALVDGVWQKAVPLEGVNSTDNEGAQAISPDGSWLVFTACNRTGDGSQGSCDLYWSQEKSTGWTKPSPFSATINSSTWDSQPTISADGKSIIFSSRRPGGRGKEDLWITQRKANGKWTPPENLGPEINTGGLENTPFLHPDGQTLYFSSDSLPGMGLRDLFVVRRTPDGTWGKPQNLGYPINTKTDEVALTVSLDGKTAYFASNRPGSKKIDIFSFELPEMDRPKPVTYAKVKVTDANTGNPMIAKLDFTDLKTGEIYMTVNTRKDGSALACLPAGNDYALNVARDRYFFYSENFNLVDSATFTKPFLLNVSLMPIPDSTGTTVAAPGKAITLRNVFFETGSSTLRPESATELDRLVGLLNQARWLRIQLNGHTDNVGSDASNLNLSEARAKAVYDYLIQKGIKPDRLKYKGFGKSKPVAPNDTDEGRAKNRRTEFESW
jgi:outer membrane protein OmpA-like peptidoglycan-associated protein